MNAKSVGDQFELEVQLALESMHYTVERDVSIAGCQIDLIARKQLDLEYKTYIVECKNVGESIGINRIRNFKSVVDAARVEIPGSTGMLICRKSFTKQAKLFAETFGILLRTIDQIYNSNFDSLKLATSIIGEYEEFDTSRFYIDLSCQTNEFGSGTIYKPVEKFLDEFFAQYAAPRLRNIGRLRLWKNLAIV